MREFAREFYSSTAWKKCREAYKKSRGYLCEECLRKGKYVPGEIVHHKVHIDLDTITDPNVLLNWDNLEVLCRECHAKEHDNSKKRYKINKDGTASLREKKDEKTYRVLVCGLPGTGKTVYTRSNLGNGVAYDLDAIASAFRLRMPHEERHQGSREMANSLLHWFVLNAKGNRIFIIRTAPTIEEFDYIMPTQVVICSMVYVDRDISADKADEYIRRLNRLERICNERGIPIERV